MSGEPSSAATCDPRSPAGAGRSTRGAPDHRHVLLLRFALVNLVAFGLLGVVYLEGWLDGALEGHTGWLSLGIFVTFLFGLIACTRRIWHANRELETIYAGDPRSSPRASAYLDAVRERDPQGRFISANLLRLRLRNEIALVRQVANTLVFLGLVGTVVGFIVALSGVSPDVAVSVDGVGSMVATLVSGMSIALYTTLIGSVLHVWLMVDYRILSTGAARLFDAVVELGEQHVGR